ncbi:MAG: SagB/ThcOx family dehydrogenase [Planctomycetota bacterium]
MSIAITYHEATKYAPETIGNHPGLDWASQPLAHKEYHGDDAVSLAEYLPIDPNPFTGQAAKDIGEWQGRSLAALSRWIFFTYGVTAVVPQPDRQLLLRAVPSAGGLYPAELYVVIRDWPDIAPGLYGYDPRRHRLMLLAEGTATAEALTEASYANAAIAKAPVLAAITGVFERSRWRYQERAYRRILLDTGHLIGNAGLVAHAVGLGMHATAAFCDDRADAALRLEQQEEGVLALIALDLQGPTARPSWTALPSTTNETTNLPLLDALHRASRLPPNRPRFLARGEVTTEALETTHGWAAGDRLRGAGVAGPVPLAADLLGYVLRRRSCRRFGQVAFSRDTLARILAAAYVPEQVGLGEQPTLDRARLATFIAVINVTGVEPGVYYLAPHQLELRPVRLGNPRQATHFIALGQDLCGDAGAVLFHTADLRGAVREMGDRAYRHLHLDAGIIGQRINLAALAEGIGASGIGGFFDDHTADLLGIPREQAVVYITALGTPA